MDVRISRWIWSLLARLPERGELSSEEIGVVRELGKKAVLVGVGMLEKEEWSEGIGEVERAFDGDGGEDEGRENAEADVINEEEIALDFDEKAGEANILNPGLTMQQEANLTSETLANPDSLPDALAAAKARILANLPADPETAIYSAGHGLGFEPVQEPIIGPVQPKNGEVEDGEDEEDAFDAKTNTKATVDMILTVAGEVYGQRDLLEFRGQWGDEQ